MCIYIYISKLCVCVVYLSKRSLDRYVETHEPELPHIDGLSSLHLHGDREGIGDRLEIDHYPVVMTNITILWKMAIEIVDLSIENGDVP